uniref:Uncharacterized protein n=1 Tax=Canis lupus familiaris TaxID=9615 RepID=A0A8C0RFA9_CANLF
SHPLPNSTRSKLSSYEWGAERAPAFQASWHSVYKDSAWIFLGVLRREPTAGDLCARWLTRISRGTRRQV